MVLGALLPALARAQQPAILDDSYGYQLASPPECPVWWCEATYKVGRARALPTNASERVEIAAARNEYEPFQLVLRPPATLSNVTVAIGDFTRQGGGPAATISHTNVEIAFVDYVPVLTNTDYLGVPGLYPDPLLPLTNSFAAAGNSNQPLWLTVYVPKDAPAGDYLASLSLQAGSLIEVPVRLHVFDFSLSDVTHTRSAFYADVDDFKWHQLTNTAQRRLVWDLYMDNYRRHRVSPYAPHLYAPIRTNTVNGEMVVDFSDFDAAMSRYLDEFGFNSFNLMGHKSPRLPGGDLPPFGPDYNEALRRFMTPIMAHLRERGWADKAYCYWADEINVTDQYRLGGLRAIQYAAPGLPRLVTINGGYQGLTGYAEIPVPIMSAGHDLDASWRAGGAEIWWYPAVGPTAPYPNNFIDHPAINPRIRAWAAEKYGVQGELYWDVRWWFKPDPETPWTVATTYYNSAGASTVNGDGLLVYPPTRTPPTAPVLAGPINSLRWELIREAMEDREYFWTLKQALARNRTRLGDEHPAVIEAQAALDAALALAPSVTTYVKDPQQLYAARRRVAEAIEGVDDGAPYVVRDPSSQAVALGGSAVLRSEALGWPAPACQWQLNGTNVPGATNASLVLSNITDAHIGSYAVVASNAVGVATSAVAKVAGYWSPPPAILLQPQPLTRRTNDTAVFSVTAVSTNPISYQWFSPANQPLVGETNSTLLMTNLQGNFSGDYYVVLSNAVAVVTSAVARLTDLYYIAPPQFVLQPTNQLRRVGETVSFTVGVTSSVPVTYVWLRDGVPVTDATTNNTLVLSNLSVARFPPAAAYWSLDEPSGQRRDSVSTNHFTPAGANILSTAGPVALAATNSAGPGQNLVTTGGNALSWAGPFTVGGWMSVNSASEADLLRKPGEFRLYYTGAAINRFRFGLGNDTNYVQDPTPGYTPGTWQFVIAWYDGETAYLQRNNGAVYTLAMPAPAATANPLSAITLYGPSGGVAADEAFVVQRVLTAAERAFLYNGGAGRSFAEAQSLFPTNVVSDAGVYQAVVCNGGGCVTSAPAVLTLDTNIPPPEILGAPLTQTQYVGGNVTFSVTATSTVPLTYSWLFNGEPIAGATNSTLTLTDVGFDRPSAVAAYWTMDETSGDRLDSVSTNHFVSSATNFVSTAGVVSLAVSNAGGADQMLTAADASAFSYSGPFTIGGWVNVGSGTAAEADLLRKSGEFRLYYTGTGVNRFRFVVGNSAGYVQDPTPGYVPGTWRYLVAWYDGTNAYIQQDGGPVYSQAMPAPLPTGNPLTALRLYSGSSGGIAADEVFFIKRVLSEAERASLYHGGLGSAFNAAAVCFGCTNRSNEGVYQAVVCNGGGCVTSAPAALTLNWGLNIVTPPQSQTRLVGDDVTFSVTVTGAMPVTYSWLFNGQPIPGATESTLTLRDVGFDRPSAAAAYWTMDEAASNRLDSASTNHFVPSATNIVSSAGVVSLAVSNANGAGQAMTAWPTATTMSYSGPFTVGGWMNVNSAGEADLLRKGTEFRLYYTGAAINRFRFAVGDGTNYVQDPTPGYVPGTWRYLVAWYDGTNAYIQQNGGTVYSQPMPAPAPGNIPMISLRLYGSGGGVAADEVFFIKRVLSDAERASLYNGGLGSAFNAAAVCFGCTNRSNEGVYRAVVCNAGGCVTSAPAVLTLDLGLNILAPPRSQAQRAGEAVTFSVNVTNVLPVTYTWRWNGAPIPDATNSSLVLSNLVQLDQPPAPASYWAMEVYSGTRWDWVSTNHLVPSATNLVSVPGVVSLAVSNANGLGQGLTAPGSNFLSYSGPFTVGGWVNVGGSTLAEADLLRKTNEFRLYYTGTTLNRFRFGLGSGTNYVQDQTSGYVPGTWRFVVAWFDGANACIQVNNGPVYWQPLPAPVATGNPVTALKLYGAPGGIAADELFVIKRVLTPNERASLYNGGLGQAFDAGLVCFDCSRQSDAGVYDVVVCNSGGCLTSAPAVLTVLDPLTLFGGKTSAGAGFALDLPANSSPAFVQASSNLVNWADVLLLPPLAAPTNVVDWSATNLPQRFYRLRVGN
jgi:hypothetical protein